jgi:hypothetical protein
MVKKVLICSFAALFLVCGISNMALSTEKKGPAELKLVSSDATKKPPAVFPHKKHQDSIECGECHHGIKDGKQDPYSETLEIKKCESCHNSDVLAGKTKGKLKLDTFKGAGHGNCLACHKAVAKKDVSKKKLKSCKTCHVK